MKLFRSAFVFALFVPVAFAFKTADLPEGPEKAMFIKVCSGCHYPEAVMGRLDTPKNWAKKVDHMIDRGAVATPEEVTQINAYLDRNFGFAPDKVHFPDGPGREPVQRVCGSCHPAEIVVTRQGRPGTRADWAKTVEGMYARGAKGSSEDMEQIITYLAANFGYIPVPSYLPDGAGKETVERVCGPCHGVSFLMDRPTSPAAWSRTVGNMVSRGAVATPDEVNEISAYLGRYLDSKNPAPKSH